ncbi:MAG TPA: class I SAM-dependent methyltransferase [Anaerolineae bacterium]|nr:class I SAM-dependent methyltransferase [Anaerolineae bacterium]HQK14961.1 class I SAM-dependent methyltransferase [Anaerolineae bacterium]
MKRIPESEAISEMADARRFNEFMGSNRFRRQEYRELALRIATLGIPDGGKVLDVGTGTGFVAIEVARLLSERGVQVVGLDLSPAMLALAAENAQRAGLNGAVTWREGNAYAMPFADGEFDAVISNDSLHHWEDPVAIFNEIARVVKPEGAYFVHDSRRLETWWPRLFAWGIGLTIPADFRVHYWGSIRSSYTPEELEALVARSRLNGWRIEAGFMEIAVVRGNDTEV